MNPEKIKKAIANKEDFINISPTGIAYGYASRFKHEADGGLSWYIPSFDIYYSSANIEEGNKLGRAMVTSFFNYWLKKKGFRTFVLQILKLGYKPSSHEELNNLLNRTNLIATLRGSYSAKNFPKEFAESETVDQTGELEMAV